MKNEENKTVLKRELEAICQELQEKMNIIKATAKGHATNTR